MIKRFFGVVFCSLSIICSQNAQNDYPLIPKPQSVVLGAGSFVLDKNVSIATVAQNEDESIILAPFALLLQQYIVQQTGFQLPVIQSSGSFSGKKIMITLHNPAEKKPLPPKMGSYGLNIETSTITLFTEGQAEGLYAGLQTLRQIIGFQKKKPIVLTCAEIIDQPAFGYRGVMFDCGRHFIPFDFLKKQVDILAFFKINTLRLHLTEDQGWRMEIKKYPKLTSVGAWRTEPNGNTHGGFYTQKELRDLVKYAFERGITIIPEIEMPGHCSAALAAYPELSCRKTPNPVPYNWGVYKDVFCAGNDQTYVFLTDVLEEVLDIFPSPMIHIGGDEVPTDRWHDCKVCQNRMITESMPNEHALQDYFILRMQRYLQSKGRTLIGWDEVLNGGSIDNQSVIEVWQNIDRAKIAFQNGNKVILAPGSHLYLDGPPASTNLQKVYSFNPFQDSVFVQNRDKILGLESPLWSEHITTNNFENMLYPRLLALAEKAWSGEAAVDFKDFQSRLSRIYPFLDSMQVGYGAEDRNICRYQLRYQPAQKRWKMYTEKGLPDMNFMYVQETQDLLDLGASLERTQFSPMFSFADSLEIKTPLRFKIAPFRKGRQYADETYYSIKQHLALGLPVQFEPTYDKRYAAAGDLGLTDGLLGSTNFNDGVWLGWSGSDMSATLDFGAEMPIRNVSIQFIQQSKSWILLPSNVEFYTSSDGKDWQLSWINEFKVQPFEESTLVLPSEWQAPDGTTARYLRIVAKNYGKLPIGHNGAGGDAWIFADEIIVR